MTLSGSIAFVTGANRGIGRAYVTALLARGAAKVYVGARDPASLHDLVDGGDGRLVAIAVDVTNAAQVASAAVAAADTTLLINNAGVAAFEGALSARDLDAARREMEVNYFGTLAMTRAFAPVLAASGAGVVVNMLSMLSLVSLPMAATYSASKAATLSLTRSLRAELLAQGTRVIGVLAVQTDTAMGSALPEPRILPAEVVDDVLDAVDAGRNDEVVAGAQSRAIHQAFLTDPAALQAAMSKRLPKHP